MHVYKYLNIGIIMIILEQYVINYLIKCTNLNFSTKLYFIESSFKLSAIHNIVLLLQI